MSESLPGEETDCSTDTRDKESSVHECPTCDYASETKHGLKIHHSKEHNSRLNGDGVNCPSCNQVFGRKDQRLEHMRNCCPGELFDCPTCDSGFANKFGMKLHHSKEHGESIAKQDIYCERCGDFVDTVYDCMADSYTHCEDCRAIRKIVRMLGPHNPQFKGTVWKDCKQCGTDFPTIVSQSENNDFCTIDCWYEWSSENIRGEEHPRWAGGKEHYYGPEWEDIRTEVLERYDYKCQGCGAHDSEGKKSHNIHHITPYDKFEDDDKAHEIDNLIPLCVSCHTDWEGIPVAPRLV